MSLAFDPVNWRDHYKGVKYRLATAAKKPLVAKPLAPVVLIPARISLGRAIYTYPIGPQEPVLYIRLGNASRPAILPPSMGQIVNEVSARFNVAAKDIRGKNRSFPVAFARQFAMYRARQECKASFPQIGQFFRRDHTTVIHAFRKIEGLIQSGELTL